MLAKMADVMERQVGAYTLVSAACKCGCGKTAEGYDKDPAKIRTEMKAFLRAHYGEL